MPALTIDLDARAFARLAAMARERGDGIEHAAATAVAETAADYWRGRGDDPGLGQLGLTGMPALILQAVETGPDGRLRPHGPALRLVTTSGRLGGPDDTPAR